MKLDMGGSAAVFGAAKALGQIKPLGVEVLHFSQPHSCMRYRGFTILVYLLIFYDFSLLTGSLSNVARHGRFGIGTPGDDYGIAQLRGACAVGHDTTFDDSRHVERS